ncbi:CLP protease proteolytic subunit 1 [Carex rostrata]
MTLLSSPPPLTSQTTAKIACYHRSVSTPPFAHRFSRLPRRTGLRCCCSFPARKDLDHIPKQFREENLSDGLMDNYKNVPECLYGLPRQQMNMFMAKDNILTRQSTKLNPESLTSDAFYKRFSNIRSLEEEIGKDTKPRVSMYQGGGYDDPPPDMPSLLIDARIVYLGMALHEAVAELIIAQLLFLDFEDSSKPIYLYINSSGTQDMNKDIIGYEALGFAIADSMSNCKAKVHTLNLGIAYGQAAVILSRGNKGNRLLLPHSKTSLHLPKMFKNIGPTTDMWLTVKDLEAEADAYLGQLSEVTGKPKEELAKDARHLKLLSAEETIGYGLADRIIYSMADCFDKQNTQLQRNKRKAMLQAAQTVRSGPGAVATSGLG